MGDVEEPIEDIEGASEEEEQLEGAGPKRKLFGPSLVRVMLYIAAALVLIVISGTVAYLVAKRAGTQPGGERTAIEKTTKKPPLQTHDLGEFSINTSDPVEPHFVKVTIFLGYDAKEDTMLQTELTQRRAQLRDIVIETIGDKMFEDLNNEEKRGILREDLRSAINNVLQEGTVHAVYFTEFVLT